MRFLTLAVTIDFKAYKRSAGFSVYTYILETFYPLKDPKHLVYHQDPKSGCPTSVMNITVNNVTRGIAFINTRPPGYTSRCQYDSMVYTGIEICEIRVMGQSRINADFLECLLFFLFSPLLSMLLYHISDIGILNV